MVSEERITRKAFDAFPGAFPGETQAAPLLRAGYIKALTDIKENIEKKYKELAKTDGGLTQEGKGYLVALGDILRFEL